MVQQSKGRRHLQFDSNPNCEEGLIQEFKRMPEGSGTAKSGRQWEQKIGHLRRLSKQHIRHSDSLGVVMLGDSITEFLAGGPQGFPRVPGAFEVWKHDIGLQYPSLLLGSAGDRAVHLLHRVSHGEFPSGFRPKVVILHIGINDLLQSARSQLEHPRSAQKLARKTVATVMGIVSHIHFYSRCRSKIILMGLLPCGDVKASPKTSSYSWPSMYTTAIVAVNQQLQWHADRYEAVDYIDCSHIMLTEDQKNISHERTIDGLHPSALGYHVLNKKCILPAITPYL
eukprot:CAMPEP_0117648700 /NCGR_PEP_ID=MMETSP0804-20121206/556_1 /TAXON_ID=1074897 /ORGANISM="Tetraselmis astigmatica, Strain CCMP880" /LENGTH=282 /DNA_ID=CAMNT_0005454343 /DNA_START=278 /DNA_END=1126 /DNA_ORIENTATION=-